LNNKDRKNELNRFHFTLLNKMGNTDSVPSTLDRPGPLMEEATRNISMGFNDAAVAKYRKAYDLYKESGEMASAARALRMAAELGLTTDLELAAKGFEEVATLYSKTDITVVAVDANLANAIYCLLAAGRTSTSKEKLEAFKTMSNTWASSVEGIACTSILTSFQTGNRNATRDRIEGFKDVHSVAGWRVKLLDKVLERL
jgi:hypothetical protein